MCGLSRILVVCAMVAVQRCHGVYSGTEILCKNNLDVCMNNVSKLLDHTKVIGIPKSKAEVDILCKGFKMGMKCLDEYSELCLSADQKNIINNNVIGARYTFKFLCDDEVFQKDYLKYTECYQVINSDWDSCAAKFMSLVHEEMVANQTEDARVLDLCCAKHGFLNCVYTTSKIKCGLEEAIFIKKIADTLSEDKLVSSVCRHIKIDHCNAALLTTYSVFTITLNILFLIIIWCY